MLNFTGITKTGFLAAVFAVLIPLPKQAMGDDACSGVLNHTVRTLGSDQSVNLCEAYAGKVVLVVNTASRCGYTYQYGGLEHLYVRYRDRGFVVLGFPSNDCGGQEPGGEEQIKQFCRDTYSVQFPMFEKVSAAEGNAHPLFQALATQAGSYPQWNCHKYLIDRQGKVVAHWRSRQKPESDTIVNAIEKLL